MLGLPLHVEAQLVDEAPRLDASPTPALDVPAEAPPPAGALPSEVPEAFRRALPG